MQRIIFEINHMVTYFAQATLIDYLNIHMPSREDYEFVLSFNSLAVPDVLNLKDKFRHAHHFIPDPDNDLTIIMHNNWDNPVDYNRLEIGEFLLKNCALGFFDDELDNIRSLYKISDERPTIVVGFVNDFLTKKWLKTFINISETADIWAIGRYYQEFAKNIPRAMTLPKIGVLPHEYGHLPKLFAVADIALKYSTFIDPESGYPCHDPIESSLNAVGFHLNNGLSALGLGPLNRIGLIRRFDDVRSLRKNLEAYVERISHDYQGFRSKMKPRLDDRLAYINHMRKTYLGVIMSHVLNVIDNIGIEDKIYSYETAPYLKVSVSRGKLINIRRIRHEATQYKREEQDLAIVLPS